MKKTTSIFLVLLLWALVVLSGGIAQAQQGADSIVRKFGGYTEYLLNTSTSNITHIAFNAWGFNLNTKESWVLGSRLDKSATSWLPVAANKRLFIKTGIWIENKWVVFTALDSIDNYAAVDEGDPAYYFSTDPTQGTINLIGNGVASRAFYPNGMAYNTLNKKLYGIQENKLLLMSLSDTSISLIATLFYKNEEGENTDAKPFNAIVCDLKGELFGVDIDHFFYKINSNTGEIAKIGALGVSSGSQKIAAEGLACDPRNGDIYFMNSQGSQSSIKRYVYIVNTATGAAKAINTTTIPQMKAWFLHYYTKNCIPSDLENIVIRTDVDNPLKTLITAKVSSLNFNREAQEDNLEKVYLYRRIPGNAQWNLVDSIVNPKPGQEIMFANIVPKTGVYEYSTNIKTKTQLYSLSFLGGRSFNYRITFPYTTGFEDNDINTPITLEGSPYWSLKDTAIAHGGKYVYFRESVASAITNEASQLVFNNIPLKKGGKYEVSFWVRKGPGGFESVGSVKLMINKTAKMEAAPLATMEWKQYKYTWEATKTEEIPIAIEAQYNYAFFVDDISIAQVGTHQMPDTAKIISAIPAPKGEQAIIVKWQNPSLNAGGEPLSKDNNYGVIIEAVSSKTPSAIIYQSDTLKNRTIGSLDSAKILSSRNGKAYYRIKSFNSYGMSPYFTVIGWSNWVGIDTIPSSPKDLVATVLENNKVKITWEQNVETGNNGGYFGFDINKWEVTYYKNSLPSNVTTEKITKVVNEKSFVAEDISDLDFYRFDIKAICEQTHKSSSASLIYSIAGIGSNQRLINNSQRLNSTSNFPLMIFSSTNNAFNSVVTQQVYSKEQMQGICVIDSLYYFMPNPPKNTSLDIPSKIYLSYKTNSDFFLDAEEKVSIETPASKMVFNGIFHIDTSTRILKVPIKPFFYDGSGSLTVTVIRKWSETKFAVPFYNADVPNGELGLWSKWRQKDTDENIDFDTVTDLINLAPYILTSKKHPILMVNKIPNLSSVKGNVKSLRSGKIIPGAQINIKPVQNGSALVDIITVVNNDSSTGNYSFNQLFTVQYEVRIAALGYVDTTVILSVEANQAYEINAVLDDAQKIDISGTIVNALNQPIIDAKIEISGITKVNTSSDEDGKFGIENVYGNTSYDLVISKPLFKTYRDLIAVEAKDTILKNLVLTCEPYAPFNLQAEVSTAQQANLNWTQPISGTTGERRIKWCLDSCFRWLQPSFAMPFQGGAHFTPAQMKEKGINGKGLKAIRVYLYDYSCNYSLIVCQGIDAKDEIYRYKVGRNRKSGWHEFNLPSLLKIDTTKDLYILMDAPNGYEGYPMGIDEGPNKGEGTSVVNVFDGGWMDIKILTGSLSANISIEGIFAYPSEVTPLNGYQVFRANALKGSEVIPNEEITTWDKISTDNTPNLKFADNTYSTLPLGVYKYMVKADYKNIISDPTYSNPVYNNIKYQVNVKFMDTIPSQIDLTFTPADGNKNHIYKASSQKGKEVILNDIWRGDYSLEITRAFSQRIVLNVTIHKDTTLTIPAFIENISEPQITSTSVEENKVIMKYTHLSNESFYDNFESYEDFAISNFGPYSLSKAVAKYELQGYKWKNSTKAQSWIVMNPKNAEPPLTINSFKPMTGESKYLLAMCAAVGTNNDWLIYSLNHNKGGSLSFFANGLGYQGNIEKMSVRYSTTGKDSADFLIAGESAFIDLEIGWTEYFFSIPENAKYIAIIYASKDLMGMMIDKFSFSDATQGKPHSFDIYLDGNKVKREAFTSTQYTFSNLTSGTHKVGIKAIFNTGESSLVEEEITITANEKENTLAGIQVGPNPTTGLCNVELATACNLDILTGQGSLLRKVKLSQGSHEIDIKSLPGGVYFFKFTNQDDTFSVKVVKL